MASAQEKKERKAFLRAILDDPNDDTTRLVYADWLEERGDPRGEFIRAQIEKEETAPYEPRYFDLLRREGQLLAAHGRVWQSEVAKWAREEGSFRRGFLSEISATCAQFRRSGRALVNAAPIECLKLRGPRKDLGEIIDDDLLSQVVSLSFTGSELKREELLLLLKLEKTSPNLKGLELRLDRSCEAIYDQFFRSSFLSGLQRLAVQFVPSAGKVDLAMKAISENGNLKGLRSLDLTCYAAADADWLSPLRDARFGELERLALGFPSRVTPGSVLSVLQSKPFQSLRALELRPRFWRPGDYEQLLVGSFGSELEELDLHDGVRERGWDLIAHAEFASGLQRLALCNNGHVGNGYEALTLSSHLSGLRSLHLPGNRIDGDQLWFLSRFKGLGTITDLDLSDQTFTPESLKRFFADADLTSLRSLVLRLCQIGPTGAEAIAGCSALKNLYRLDLEANLLGDEGVQILAASPHLTHLGELNLARNRIRGDGIGALARSPILQEVHTLILRANGFGDDGSRVLRESEFLKNIVHLNVMYSQVGHREAQALREQFGLGSRA